MATGHDAELTFLCAPLLAAHWGMSVHRGRGAQSSQAHLAITYPYIDLQISETKQNKQNQNNQPHFCTSLMLPISSKKITGPSFGRGLAHTPFEVKDCKRKRVRL